MPATYSIQKLNSNLPFTVVPQLSSSDSHQRPSG